MKNNLLKHIDNPQDLRKLTVDQLPIVAQNLRDFIIDIVSVKEGHLGASLGVVELTIALHYVFDTPNDLLVWDVGHQAYGHKILTGRKNNFDTNRQLNGISGFPKRSESEFDTFGTGHSSTSISAILGMALASQLNGDNNKQHVAVIGDASIASGMAFEALNHAGITDANILIILNDNAMGIDPNVGALKDYLSDLKKGKKNCDTTIFEALNFDYSGPINGHDLQAVIAELKRLQHKNGPRFLHLITTKGKGLAKAEENQVTYHAPGKFNKISGEIIKTDKTAIKYQDVFGHTIVELAKHNEKIVGITPAMPTGSSLKYMMEAFPKRAFDVGIAEQHAVTLAAGMATQNYIPFCTIYSTFLQRAYDQIIHDVALQNLPVIFCVDRAGLVGEDGATHHGVFDIAFLRCIPNLIVCAPLNAKEFQDLLFTAQLGLKSPIAIRYPRGKINSNSPIDYSISRFSKINIGKGSQISNGEKIAVLSIGTIGNNIISICENSKYSNIIAHYNMIFIKPLDAKLLHQICEKFDKIITIEDGVLQGGFGSALLEFLNENNYPNIKLKRLGIPDNFIEHGTTEELHELTGLSLSKIKNVIDGFI
ncbi:MAG: 1-deoxy-D-xylulose-5-phosphate synthase [Flavobacteriaceae bacterium]